MATFGWKWQKAGRIEKDRNQEGIQNRDELVETQMIVTQVEYILPIMDWLQKSSVLM